MSEERTIDSPPAGAQAWREVWESDVRYPPRPSRNEWLFRLLRRIFRRAGEPDAERQKNFNLAVLDVVEDVRRDIATMRDDLKRDLAAVQLDVRQADEALATELGKVHDLIPVAARRNDALIAALDQKIETVAVRLRDLAHPVIAAEGGGAALAADFLYRRLEDALRGPVDVAAYVERARNHQPVLDIGCGRGEFLIACRDEGIEAHGFDINERSVADLRARSINATLAGVPECFNAVDDRSIGGILALHVVEHLPLAHLFALFGQAARVLRPGGLLMIETPNAESIFVSASEFWRDPTHLAPRHPAALTLLAREHGFSIDEIRPIHPLPEGHQVEADEEDPPALRRVIEVINERVFGPQDLRLVLRRD